jgi:hypothetical protein
LRARALFLDGRRRGKKTAPLTCLLLQKQQQQGTGFDIVALSDTDPDYPNSCGNCYAIACRRAVIQDGYGETLDRTSTCYDESRQVIVMVTDTCPCVYPANAMSNKRWCCGDKPHVDMSTQAFRKLGDTSHGVMAARWKRVECPTEPTYKQWDQQGSGGVDSSSNKKSGSRRMLGAPAAAPVPAWALGA